MNFKITFNVCELKFLQILQTDRLQLHNYVIIIKLQIKRKLSWGIL